MADILTTLITTPLAFYAKIALLVVIGCYLLFSLVLLNQTRSLNKLLFIDASQASRLIVAFAIAYSLLIASLFLLALVIL